jgi:hypothetical protein
MRDKWNIKEKGYLKIHVATVDVKSKKILSKKVTNEHIHYSRAVPELIENIIKSNSMTIIGKLLADYMIFLDVYQIVGSIF